MRLRSLLPLLALVALPACDAEREPDLGGGRYRFTATMEEGGPVTLVYACDVSTGQSTVQGEQRTASLTTGQSVSLTAYGSSVSCWGRVTGAQANIYVVRLRLDRGSSRVAEAAVRDFGRAVTVQG